MFLKNLLKNLKCYFSILFKRILEDRMTMMASSLAFTSLLSLVPLITVVFFLLSAFPMFAGIKERFQEFIFANLVPTAGDMIQSYLGQFVANSNKMTAIGIIGLIITAVLVIDSINSALNHIFRAKRKRSIFYSFAIYWTLLSVGPILIGIGIALSSYLFSLHIFDSSVTTLHFRKILMLLPYLFSCLAFWALYCLVPTEPVRIIDATIGAVFAAILFELSKKIFSFYISSFATYQLIYGVLAALPILFLWVYLAWCIVLLGAEISASLGDYYRLKHGEEVVE